MLQLIKAPSILGLRPTGVEKLADTMLKDDMRSYITSETPMLEIEDLNYAYSGEKDKTGMINALALHDFSLRLKYAVVESISKGRFPVVLGGDCSNLVGVMYGLKTMGTYGLVTLDAHADFYLPGQSETGEASDMDIALVTGRGPDILSDIESLGPYVNDEHVIHIGQRDQEETIQYGSAQIEDTKIVCYSLDKLHDNNMNDTSELMIDEMKDLSVEGFWMHFDTDVINDDENPAVDYRLPGGLKISECRNLMGNLISSGLVKGLSISIYNPDLDKDGTIGKNLTDMIKTVLTYLA